MARVKQLIAPGIGILLAVIYGVIARLVFGFDGFRADFGVMSVGFVFLVPLPLGALTVFFAPEPKRRSWLYGLMMPWASSGACLMVAMVLAWEVGICLLMAAPIFLGMASIGGLATCAVFVLLKRGNKTNTTLLLALLLAPYAWTPLELRADVPHATRTVESTIVIRADADTVWQHIIRFAPLSPDEQKPTFFRWAGLPRPLYATLNYEGLGGVRRGHWEDGLAFNGTIVEWEDGTRYRLLLEPDTGGVRESAGYLREIGGQYFDMLDDRYEIEPLGDGAVRLHLSSSYRLSTRFNPYGMIWTDIFMRDIQTYILRIVKARSEAGL